MKWALAISALLLLAGAGAAGWWLHTRPPPTETWLVTFAQAGSNASELQSAVSPAEHALLMLPGLRSVRETTRNGISEFRVETAPDSEIYEGLSGVQRMLPSDMLPPVLSHQWPDTVEERFVFTSDELPLVEASRLARETFEMVVTRQKGTRGIEWCGLVDREVHVQLDLQRVRALGQKTDDVINSLSAARDIEAVMKQVRDVATVESASSTPDCVAFRDGRAVLVATVRHHRDSPLTIPPLPPMFKLERVEAPVEEWVSLDEKAPRLSGLVLQRGHRITAFAPLDAPPGLALLRRNGGVAVQVLGPREVARDAAMKLREALAKESGWTGVVPDLRLPVKRLKADRSDAARLVAKLLNDRAGWLADRTPIVVQTGDDFMEAQLADGSPLSAHVTIQLEQAPESLLRIDAQDAFEFFTSVENPEHIVKAQQLPPGVQVRVVR